MFKGICLSVWNTKDFSIGGNNFTNLNFATLDDQVKFVDTFKYYKRESCTAR